MNIITRKIFTIAAVLMLCLFSLEQSATAQNNCMPIKGNLVLTYNPVTDIWSGPVKNAGILNGTFQEVNNSCCLITPDTDVVTLLSDLTITTNRGQLKSSTVITADNVSPFPYTEFGPINPNTSTGRFAGATGLIFLSGKSVGDVNGPYHVELTGEVCFAD